MCVYIYISFSGLGVAPHAWANPQLSRCIDLCVYIYTLYKIWCYYEQILGMQSIDVQFIITSAKELTSQLLEGKTQINVSEMAT